jgi:glycosyltransferase involved in cell wall biosynthesis
VPPYLTVLMPAYNEEQNLLPNTALLMGTLAGLGVDFELLIVDDGSHDATSQIADELAARDARVRVIHHPRNLGIGRALHTGFRAARGEFTIFIPTDLAMRLEELPKYLEAARHADVVVGLRSDRRDTSLSRRIVGWANIALVRLLFAMPLRQFQYICMYRTRFLHEIDLDYPDSAFIQAEVLIKARDLGYTMTEVIVSYIPRTGGSASGARWRTVVKSTRDLAHFWLRWLFKARDARGGRDWRKAAIA